MKLILLLVPMLLVGCSATIRGVPQRAISADIILTDVSVVTSLDAVNACNIANTTECRDRIVYSAILGIDLNYHKFETELMNDDRDLSFGSTLSQLGLGMASAYTGSVLYSSIATGIVGTSAAYNSKILQNQIVSTLQAEMTSQRNIVKARIFSNLTKPIDQYPLTLATLDIESYYTAGTITHALKELNNTASTHAVTSSTLLQNTNKTITTP